MNKKFHTINLGRANPSHTKAALFSGAGFTHAEIEKARFEKGKCYEIKSNGGTYQIRFIEGFEENIRGEYWYGNCYGGLGAFCDAELVREIPQIPIKMVRGERYRAQLKNVYGDLVWRFDFDKIERDNVFPRASCDELEGYDEYSKGKPVAQSDIVFIVPEHIWNEHYAK